MSETENTSLVPELPETSPTVDELKEEIAALKAENARLLDDLNEAKHDLDLALQQMKGPVKKKKHHKKDKKAKKAKKDKAGKKKKLKNADETAPKAGKAKKKHKKKKASQETA